MFASFEPFLIANFLCYFVISILYAVKKSEQRQALVDGNLVFGTPLIAFLMQYALVKNMTYGVFASTFALGGLYLLTTNCLGRMPCSRNSADRTSPTLSGKSSGVKSETPLNR